MVLLRALRGHSLHHTLPSKTKTYLSPANTAAALKEIPSWFHASRGIEVTLSYFSSVRQSFYSVAARWSHTMVLYVIVPCFYYCVGKRANILIKNIYIYILFVCIPSSIFFPFIRSLRLTNESSLPFLVKWTVLHLTLLPYRKVTVCKTNKRENKEKALLHYSPFTSFSRLRSLSLHPLLPLFAALLPTVTAALITPLWSLRVAATCHQLPRGPWVITSIHPRAVAPVPRSPWR